MTNKQLGVLFSELIKKKGYTPYSLSKSTDYSLTRLYGFVNGEYDIRKLTIPNAVVLARALGYRTIEDFYKELRVDIFYDRL